MRNIRKSPHRQSFERKQPSRSRSGREPRTATRRVLRAERLDARQLMAANIFHNEAMPEDVNEDGQVSSVDVLTVINQIRGQGTDLRVGEPVDASQPESDRGRGRRLDVNNDGRADATDALMVINRLRRGPQSPSPTVDAGQPVGNVSGNDDPGVDLERDRRGERDDRDDADPIGSQTDDVVLQLNETFAEILAADEVTQNPGYASRAMAILNLAIHDAVQIATDGTRAQTFYNYDLNLNQLRTDALSADVAAAHAAHTVLSGLYPDQQSTIDAMLVDVLEPFDTESRESNGSALGEQIGGAILELRADDGSDVDGTGTYTYTDEIGYFQADPENPSVPTWGPLWGDVDPFSISGTEAFRPESTPDLDSQQYADSYNEVLELGSVDSQTRTADQTEAGIFWAYDREGLGTPMALFNDILRGVADQQGNSMLDNAVLFAQASVAMADAGIVAWDTKFGEEFWRPVTAIEQGDFDGNALTQGDPDWVALGAPDGGDDIVGFTPQFPTYVSGHATFGAALFGSLREFYGTDDIAFDVTSRELEILIDNPQLQEAYGLDLDDATRSFESFSEAMAENGRSRVYLGIHFDFDDVVGQQVGQAIAASVAADFADPSTDSDRDRVDPNDADRPPRNQRPPASFGTTNDRIGAIDDVFRRGFDA